MMQTCIECKQTRFFMMLDGATPWPQAVKHNSQVTYCIDCALFVFIDHLSILINSTIQFTFYLNRWQENKLYILASITGPDNCSENQTGPRSIRAPRTPQGSRYFTCLKRRCTHRCNNTKVQCMKTQNNETNQMLNLL